MFVIDKCNIGFIQLGKFIYLSIVLI